MLAERLQPPVGLKDLMISAGTPASSRAAPPHEGRTLDLWEKVAASTPVASLLYRPRAEEATADGASAKAWSSACVNRTAWPRSSSLMCSFGA
jgi:hypothetical protein